MRPICVLICSVDQQTPGDMTELAAFALPAVDVAALQPETALDDIEATTHQTGHAILRRVPQAQWETIDTALAEQYRQRFPLSKCEICEHVLAIHHGPFSPAEFRSRQSLDCATSNLGASAVKCPFTSQSWSRFQIGWLDIVAALTNTLAARAAARRSRSDR